MLDTDMTMLRTHDDVRALLRGVCDRLGARWETNVLPPDRKGYKHATYSIRLERIGQSDLSEVSSYSLPVPAKNITAHVHTMIEGAAKAADKDSR